MNIEDIREYCISKTGVTEEFPFDDVTLVFKVMGKMFLLAGLERQPPSFNAKCDPERAIALREEFPAIRPGYHMSKVHWNTVELDGSVPPGLVYKMIDDSYDLVVAGLTRAGREELRSLED